MNSSAFNLLYSPALTSIHDYWKNHSFDYTDLCRENDGPLYKLVLLTSLPTFMHTWLKLISQASPSPCYGSCILKEREILHPGL